MRKNYRNLLIAVIVGIGLLIGSVVLISTRSKGPEAQAFGTDAPNATQAAFIEAHSTPLAPLMTADIATANALNPVKLGPGVPAIKLKVAVAAAKDLGTTSLTTNLTTISFTETDVRNYLANHGIMGIEADKSKTGINSIQFIPVKTVNAILSDNSTGLPLEKVVCFVTMGGDFKAVGAPTTFSKSYMLFDAATGNFIMSGEMK
jgi:hypothetical protein